MDAQRQLAALEARCRSLEPMAVAFSGGLDSRFLCHAAVRAGVAVRALHIAGPHIPQAETEEARQWARERGIPFILLRADPLDSPAIRANGADRCYHCKLAVFTALCNEVRPEETLCDGTNASDLTGYRPGLKALKELAVVSPLADAGLVKDAIRSLARETGMDRPDQKARPCLFTRFEYGLEPDAVSLAALDAAERQVEAILEQTDPRSSAPFRLRLTKQGPVLHIQTTALKDGLRQALTGALREHGFAGAAIEPVDRISGFFDRQRNLPGA